jgi:hypothetical protein
LFIRHSSRHIPIAILLACAQGVDDTVTDSPDDSPHDSPIDSPDDPSIPTGDVLRTEPLPPATSAAPGYDVVAGPTAETCTWGLSEPKGLTLDDLDGDGWVDILEPRCDHLTIHFGGEDGWTMTRVDDLDYGAAVYTHDLDEDGLADVVWLGSEGVRLFLNDGARGLVPVDMGLDYCDTCTAPPDAPPGMSIHHLTVQDVDRDGDHDLMLGGFSFGPELLVIEGRGGGGSEYALPNELWLRDGDRFVRDPTFPTNRAFTMHALVETHDAGTRFHMLNDFSTPYRDRPEYEQLATCSFVEGSAGAWDERHFRDLGLDLQTPMGGWLTDLDEDGGLDFVVSRLDGLKAFRQRDGSYYEVTDLWGLPRSDGSVTWSVMPVDPTHDGTRAMYVSNGPFQEPSERDADSATMADAIFVWNGQGFDPDTAWLTAEDANSRAAIVGDVNGDGRPDIAVRQLGQSSPTAAIHLYVDRGGAGHVAELRFDGCPPLGGQITSSLYDAPFLPYNHGGSFGNAPTDRLTIPLGDLDEDTVQIRWLDGTTREITVSSDTRAWVRCPDSPTP